MSVNRVTYHDPANGRWLCHSEKNPVLGHALLPREEEILGYIMQGMTGTEIAKRLVLSLKTIDTHRTRIYRKLGAKTAAHAVYLYLTAKSVAASSAGVAY